MIGIYFNRPMVKPRLGHGLPAWKKQAMFGKAEEIYGNYWKYFDSQYPETGVSRDFPSLKRYIVSLLTLT